MAFSNLTSLTEAQYKALNASFSKTPNSSSTGSPDNRVSIQLKGWVNDTVLAFQITTAAAAGSSLGLDSTVVDTMDINVVASTSSDPTYTYWTVDVGSDNRITDWSVNFNVAANNRNTGVWKFTKGKSDDDKY